MRRAGLLTSDGKWSLRDCDRGSSRRLDYIRVLGVKDADLIPYGKMPGGALAASRCTSSGEIWLAVADVTGCSPLGLPINFFKTGMPASAAGRRAVTSWFRQSGLLVRTRLSETERRPSAGSSPSDPNESCAPRRRPSLVGC